MSQGAAVGEREKAREFAFRSLDRLSGHAGRRYGLLPGTARSLASGILESIARLLRTNPALPVPPRLLLSVLQRWALSALSRAAVDWPNLRTLCGAAFGEPTAPRRAACRRAVFFLAREQSVGMPWPPPEDRPTLFGPEDWGNAVLASLRSPENPARSPWVHPDAAPREPALGQTGLRSEDPAIRRRTLVGLEDVVGLDAQVLLDAHRLRRHDPDVSVRRAARAVLLRRVRDASC